MVFHTSSPSLVAVLKRMAFFCASELRATPLARLRGAGAREARPVKRERARQNVAGVKSEFGGGEPAN